VEIHVVARDLDMPEGPCLSRNGSLFVVEIGAGWVTAIDVAAGQARRHGRTGGGPNGCALGADGFLYVANNGGVQRGEEFVDVTVVHGPGRIERCDPQTGEVEVAFAKGSSGDFSGPNDLAVDSDGGLWFTDPGHGDVKEPRGRIYYASPGGQPEVVAGGYQYCNGLAFTPDGSSLLVAETGSRSLWRHPVDRGKLGERELFARLPRGGGPDGLCLDSSGNVVVAGAFLGCIFVYDEQGNEVEVIEVPDRLVTNVAFGGDGLSTLFATLTMNGELVAIEWPVPGLPLSR
jgi:gluconolactonase